MTITKNKSTDFNREFWKHVEEVASQVRQTYQISNDNEYRCAEPPDNSGESNSGHE